MTLWHAIAIVGKFVSRREEQRRGRVECECGALVQWTYAVERRACPLCGFKLEIVIDRKGVDEHAA